VLIKTNADILTFIKECTGSPIVFNILPVNENNHPANDFPLLCLFKNINTSKIYTLSFGHPDLKSNVSNAGLIFNSDLNLWAINKKSSAHLTKQTSFRDLNYHNFLNNIPTIELNDIKLPIHVSSKNFTGSINKCIPLVKHIESFNNATEISNLPIPSEQEQLYFEFFIKLESSGLFVNEQIATKYKIPTMNGLAYTNYNLYTSTGRPSNAYGGINYAALNKTSGIRESFISRFGKNGNLVLIDYSAFHPRLICKLIDYKISTDVDIYEYLAKLYFQTATVSEEEIQEAKRITFRQLYGEVDEKYKHIKFLRRLQDYIELKWKEFESDGYVKTPYFGRKIFQSHIENPTPSKVFNYILQAAEGEISIKYMNDAIKYLSGKKTIGVLYTYDSILFLLAKLPLDLMMFLKRSRINQTFILHSLFQPKIN